MGRVFVLGMGIICLGGGGLGRYGKVLVYSYSDYLFYWRDSSIFYVFGIFCKLKL